MKFKYVPIYFIPVLFFFNFSKKSTSLIFEEDPCNNIKFVVHGGSNIDGDCKVIHNHQFKINNGYWFSGNDSTLICVKKGDTITVSHSWYNNDVKFVLDGELNRFNILVLDLYLRRNGDAQIYCVESGKYGVTGLLTLKNKNDLITLSNRQISYDSTAITTNTNSLFNHCIWPINGVLNFKFLRNSNKSFFYLQFLNPQTQM